MDGIRELSQELGRSVNRLLRCSKLPRAQLWFPVVLCLLDSLNSLAAFPDLPVTQPCKVLEAPVLNPFPRVIVPSMLSVFLTEC